MRRRGALLDLLFSCFQSNQTDGESRRGQCGSAETPADMCYVCYRRDQKKMLSLSCVCVYVCVDAAVVNLICSLGVQTKRTFITSHLLLLITAPSPSLIIIPDRSAHFKRPISSNTRHFRHTQNASLLIVFITFDYIHALRVFAAFFED